MSRIDEKLLGEAVSEFLRRQPEEKRLVFMQRYWHLDSIADIAKEFHFSESKVKTMLFRSRNELREYLEKEGYDL